MGRPHGAPFVSAPSCSPSLDKGGYTALCSTTSPHGSPHVQPSPLTTSRRECPTTPHGALHPTTEVVSDGGGE